MPSHIFALKPCRTSLLLGLALWAVTPASAMAQNADMLSAVEAWRSGDDLAAVRLWMPLAERGNADAQFNLGQAFKLGRGVAQDISMAEVWYRRAAQQGHVQAEDNLGLVLFASGQRVGAMHYIRRSAARGEARALFLLGTAHFNGDLAEQDWPRAYALIRRASETGLSLAASRVAELDQLIPEDQRKQGLFLLARLHGEEEAARIAGKPAAPSMAAPPASSAAATDPAPIPAPPPMIDIAPAAMNASLDQAGLIQPEMAPAPRPKVGVSFTPPALPPTLRPLQAEIGSEVGVGVGAEVEADIQPDKLLPTETARLPMAPAAIPSETTAAQAAVPMPQPEPISQSGPKIIELPPSQSAPAPAPSPERETEPTPAPVTPPVAPKKAATGPWRLQLGAFSQSANAQRLWSQLGAKYPEIARRRPIITTSGRFTMLYAGAFTSRAEAASLCNKLKNADENCLILD